MIEARFSGRTLQVLQADVTRERVDAIVTAANRLLCGGNQAGFGGGVDGAVHRAAGPRLLEALATFDGCPPGEAVITHAGDLPVRNVIHAVGPIFGDHAGREDELLAAAHRRSLELAAGAGCRSIAFPAISCGVYRFPRERAAPIALGAIADHLAGETSLELVRYCLFGDDDERAFAAALAELERDRGDR